MCSEWNVPILHLRQVHVKKNCRSLQHIRCTGLAQLLQAEVTADGFTATKGMVAEQMDIFHLASTGSRSNTDASAWVLVVLVSRACRVSRILGL